MIRITLIIMSLVLSACAEASETAPSPRAEGLGELGELTELDSSERGASEAGIDPLEDAGPAAEVTPASDVNDTSTEREEDVHADALDAALEEEVAVQDTSPQDAASIPEEDSSLSEGEWSWPEGLYGSVPPTAFPPPEFLALNHDGESRGPEDLMGKPTVMWFFPFAGTPG